MSFTVYRASAGSGKTFTLVKEYLRFALNDSQSQMHRFKQILAITFTNKAAGEMKERVIKALTEISSNSQSKYATDLGIENSDLQKRAQNLLKSILHNYSELSIGTIDSFVHRLIRTFAAELNVSQNFEIEMDGEAMLNEAIETLISKTGTDELLTNALIEFAENKADDERSWFIENDLKDFSKQLLKEDNLPHLENLKQLDQSQLQEIKNVLAKRIKSFEDFLFQNAFETINLIKYANLTPSLFHYKESGVYGYINKLATKRFDGIYSKSRAIDSLNNEKWLNKDAGQSDISNFETIKDKVSQHTRLILNKVEESGSDYIVWGLIYKNVFSLIILNEIEKEIISYKERYNTVPISEFNSMISNVVSREPVPFIYERIGERYKNYMIDEFQDTSILHWQNLLPLIENALSEGNGALLVGDGKQAIYRWRGGDVEQFANLPEPQAKADELTIERTLSIKNFYTPKILETNYRSKAEVVQFNNDLFNTLTAKLADDHQAIYFQQEQKFDNNNTGGYIKIQFREEDQVEDDWNFEQTEKYISQCIKQGYHYKDIAIIVRENKNGIKIIDHLSNKNIPVISSESLLLKNSNEVNFILNALRFTADHFDTISATGIIEYLFNHKKINISSEAFASHTLTFEFFVSILKESGYTFNFSTLNNLPIYEACETIMRAFEFNSTDPYLVYFLEEILEYTSKNTGGRNDLFAWWEKRKTTASLAMPEDVDAIKILSIHKSKGLEFPVVILPYATWSLKGKQSKIWVNYKDAELPFLQSILLPLTEKLEHTIYNEHYRNERDRELLDNLNLLYVACTRPRERLYILSGEAKKMDIDTNITHLLMHYLLEKGINDPSIGFELGEPKNVNTIQKSHVKNNFDIKGTKTFEWNKRISIKKRNNLTISDLQKEKILFGNLIHEILSEITSISEVSKKLNTRLLRGEINQQQFTKIEIHLAKLLSNPQVKYFFDPTFEIKSERDIILPNGEVYRPDRVLVKDNKAIIIDYKTGEESPSHANQIKHYATLLGQMGYSSTELYLIYTDSEKVLNIK